MSNDRQSRVSLFDNTNLSKASTRNEKKRKRRKILYAAISVLLICVALLVISAVFCRVAAVDVSGVDIYTDETIMEAAGIKYGMQLMRIDRHEAEENIKKSLTGIESVKISYALPNKVKIKLTKGVPVYSFAIGDKLYYISENFIALGSDVEIKEDDTVYRLDAVQIKKYVSGSKIEFYDDDWYYIIDELLSSLKACGLAEKLTVIETSDKFNITVRYDGRIRITLGEFEDIDEKLKFAKSTIQSLSEDAVGTIRIKDYKVGSFLRGEY